MIKYIRTVKHLSSGAASIKHPMIGLLLLLAFTSTAQINLEKNTIFVSGQVTNEISGAPISNHKVYILSDSVTNNGFYYYTTLYTDVNGLYYDTVMTDLLFGSLKFQVFDFQNNPEEAEKFYRFNWSDNYHMVADFQIYDPNTNYEFQANFEYTQDTAQNSLKVNFRDFSYGFEVKSWLWHFGDGHLSMIQDPVHEYAEAGTYMVTLTISQKNVFNDSYNTSTITKQVMVGYSEYYNMGGHVYSGYFPIDNGLAYLYIMDENNKPVPIDTTEINILDDYGFYDFYQVIEGNYMVKARLEASSQHYGKYIPTYYGDDYIWEEADIIHLDKDKFSYHIHLIESDMVASGPGTISGNIIYDTSTALPQNIPAENIEIILLNNEEVGLNCTLSDLLGDFGFNNLATGVYQLYPDITGIDTEPMFITISDDQPGGQAVSLVITPQQVMFSINENYSEFVENGLKIFPNPSSGMTWMQIEMKQHSEIRVMVYDEFGRKIKEERHLLKRGNNDLPVDISELSSGWYTVAVLTADHVLFTGKVLKIR